MLMRERTFACVLWLCMLAGMMVGGWNGGRLPDNERACIGSPRMHEQAIEQRPTSSHHHCSSASRIRVCYGRGVCGNWFRRIHAGMFIEFRRRPRLENQHRREVDGVCQRGALHRNMCKNHAGQELRASKVGKGGERAGALQTRLNSTTGKLLLNFPHLGTKLQKN